MHPIIKAQMEPEDAELEIAPLIDVVFLLLIFFMVTSSLRKSEADLGITLPGTVKQSQPVAMPDEQIIEIDADNRIIINGRVFQDKSEFGELIQLLERYKAATDAIKMKAMVTIAPSDKSKHYRVVDVLDACAAAKLKNVTFSPAE